MTATLKWPPKFQHVSVILLRMRSCTCTTPTSNNQVWLSSRRKIGGLNQRAQRKWMWYKQLVPAPRAVYASAYLDSILFIWRLYAAYWGSKQELQACWAILDKEQFEIALGRPSGRGLWRRPLSPREFATQGRLRSRSFMAIPSRQAGVHHQGACWDEVVNVVYYTYVSRHLKLHTSSGVMTSNDPDNGWIIWWLVKGAYQSLNSVSVWKRFCCWVLRTAFESIFRRKWITRVLSLITPLETPSGIKTPRFPRRLSLFQTTTWITTHHHHARW